MIVDISPMVVNRTGVYHIVRDTVKFLFESGYKFTLTAIGEFVGLEDFVNNDYQIDHLLNNKLLEKLMTRIESSQPVDYKFWEFEVVDGSCLVFDPLYLMFLPRYKKMLCMVHDLTPVTRPQWHGDKVCLRYVENYKLLYNKDIKIISISESTTRDLWANLGINPDRVNDIVLYDRFESVLRVQESIAKEFLFVGSLELRKNVIGLIKAFELSRLSDKGFILNIVGGDALGSDQIKKLASNVSGVRILGRVDDKTLNELYDKCIALAYPSYWEGFGMPALEAANRGVPMILSESGASPEIVGPNAIYVDPCNIKSIASGLRKLYELHEQNPESLIKMAKSAAQYAKKYSFKKYSTLMQSLITTYLFE